MAQTDSPIRWTMGGHWMMVFFSLYGTLVPHYQNDDDKIIQLTEGGEIEEQQEPELTTTKIPR